MALYRTSDRHRSLDITRFINVRPALKLIVVPRWFSNAEGNVVVVVVDSKLETMRKSVTAKMNNKAENRIFLSPWHALLDTLK